MPASSSSSSGVSEDDNTHSFNGEQQRMIYVLHENDEWLPPLRASFEEKGLKYVEWHLGKGGEVDLNAPPPQGIFFNRMSASSHTRDHRYAAEHTHAVLEWLETHGRRVVNGTSALLLEVSKVRQYSALTRSGIKTPRTIVVTGQEGAAFNKQLVAAADKYFGEGSPGEGLKFITKHNRAGKGLGVHGPFKSASHLGDFLASGNYIHPVDGITLLQEFISSPHSFITRVEFIAGRFMYAVRVDSKEGVFELCPADHCQLGPSFCPVGQVEEEEEAAPDVCFTIRRDIDADHPIVKQFEKFLQVQGIEVAGVEFIESETGEHYTYDVNTNTNYNSDAETSRFGGRKGMVELAAFLGTLARE